MFPVDTLQTEQSMERSQADLVLLITIPNFHYSHNYHHQRSYHFCNNYSSPCFLQNALHALLHAIHTTI